MPYNEELAGRIRALTAGDGDIAEQKMFGGLAFLVGGNMAIAASGEGGIMVRVATEDSEVLIGSTPAELVEMRGRKMTGWLRLAAPEVASDTALREWVERGTAFARSLPAKR